MRRGFSRARDKNATCGGIVEGINSLFWLDKPIISTNRLIESSTLSVIAMSFTLATGFGTFHGMESRQGQSSTKPTPLEPQAPRRAGQQRKPGLTQAVWKREAPTIRGLFFVGLRRDWP
jgi:hypothetical protein